MARGRRKNGAGSVRQLPSGRWQARYRDDDDRLRPAPITFDTKLDAAAWLADYADGDADLERPERKRVPTFEEYAEAWLASGGRRGALKPRTTELYRQQLDTVLIPYFGKIRLNRITPTKVRAWYGTLDATTPTKRRQVYGLLSGIMATAVRDGEITEQPCTVDGAHKRDRKSVTTVATPAEVALIADKIAPRYRAAVLLAFWCALRQGEILELRRGDVDLVNGEIRIDRAVTRTSAGFVVGDPKSEAGKRIVAVPSNVRADLEHHLKRYVEPGKASLLFPARQGGHLSASALYSVFYRARKAAGRPDLRWHDLRHSGLTLAAQKGATTADLMGLAGHGSPRAALIYQHTNRARAHLIAEAMSEEAVAANVVPIKSRRRSVTGK